MPLVIAQADAKVTKSRKAAQKAPKVIFFDYPDEPDMPHATMNGHTGDVVGNAHFHKRDQFQVVVDGEFTLGRHELSPYSVHFSRAYTPYGPLVPKHGGDYTFIVMRAHRDAGPQYLSTEMDQLRAVPDRKPWQISRKVTFPASQSRSADAVLENVPGVTDENGLAAHALVLKPNAKTAAPDPAHSDGQYIIVVKGSLFYDHKEHKPYTLVFVKPDEGAFQLSAGAEGLEAIVLNFPQLKPRSDQVQTPAAVAGFKKWQCLLCAFAYDEALGMPEEGVAPGTRWEDVPESWSCPDCSASKADFLMVEV